MILELARGFVGELLVRAGRRLLGEHREPEIAPEASSDPDAPEPGFRSELSPEGEKMRTPVRPPRVAIAPPAPLEGSREWRAAAARARATR